MILIINDLVFEETDEYGDNTIHGNHFKYNGIDLESVYHYDPVQVKFYTWSSSMIKNKLGDENFNKIKPYLIITQI
uniref:Uncharacterized protein n=1 Tax=viral metagenome TaxID=1070528 RepID=A0A6C0JKN6_9ZZZZ